MRQHAGSCDSSKRAELGISESNLREKQNHSIMSGEEEKVVGLDGPERLALEEEEIVLFERSRSSGTRSQCSGGLKKTESHHSKACADGYTLHHDGDESSQRLNRAETGVVSPERYLVAFDGDADPENPRSMSTLRRWVIVLICAASSLCV
jgi:hypothetical protein